MKQFVKQIRRYSAERMLLLCAVFLISCNGENVPDCVQNAGEIQRIQVEVEPFSQITVFENLNLVLRQGEEQQVELESGEFLLNEISATVEEGRLIIRNENNCNFVRDYGISTVYVTAPNITEIRSSTGQLISSDGVLAYPNLALISESFNNPETETTDGSFDLEVDSERISISVNGIAYFELRGLTDSFVVFIASGDSRIEAENLIAENVDVNHRGTNDVFVNPQQRISGVIRGTGDVISLNRPPEIEVEEIFNGRLRFRD
ncbi:MAG: head GIN domain-containing protein [Bacteroidota bacterium]